MEQDKQETKADGPNLSSFIIVSSNPDPKSRDIKIENLTVRIPDGKGTVLLEDLNLTIAQGDIIGLTGASGSGKTTSAKALLGKHDTGSGHVSIPQGLKTKMILQHVKLSNTSMRGILNQTPSDSYIFTDRELRDALIKVGLPQLVQLIPGQQAEILMDGLLAEIPAMLESHHGKWLTEDDMEELKEQLLVRTEELVKDQFDYAQHVPGEQRAYLAEKLSAVFTEKMPDRAPSNEEITDLANEISDRIDAVLARTVTKGLQKAVEQAAYYNTRGKIWWPRLPLTPDKAAYFNWRLKRSLDYRLEHYMQNRDTEDPSREIVLNEAQINLISRELAAGVRHEMKAKHVRKGVLSWMFNVVTWPLHLMAVPLRASRTAKELTQVLASYMEQEVMRGKGDELTRRLSGGQLKKLMAARALLHKPDLLVMDEITTGVDDAAKRPMYKEILDAIPKETTVISILHDLELMDMHTRHAKLADKKLTVTDIDPDDPDLKLCPDCPCRSPGP